MTALTLAVGCGATEPRPRDDCRGRARALAVALEALAGSEGVEAPRDIVGGFDRLADPVCPAGGVEGRVRCHLARPTLEVASACVGGQWLFTISLPDLSDHVHRARVWEGAGGLTVRIDSEN